MCVSVRERERVCDVCEHVSACVCISVCVYEREYV